MCLVQQTCDLISTFNRYSWRDVKEETVQIVKFMIRLLTLCCVYISALLIYLILDDCVCPLYRFLPPVVVIIEFAMGSFLALIG